MSAGDTISSRAFEPPADTERLGHFVAASTARCSLYALGHPGNLWWSMYYSTAVDPQRSAQLWEDAGGKLLGFAWLDGGELCMHVDPALRGSGLLEAPMLAWAEEQLGARSGDGAAELSVLVAAGDNAYHALLTHHGYQRQDDAFVLLERDLRAPIQAQPLPAGVAVRHLAGLDDYAQRVDVHRDAFAPSGFSLEAYRRLRTAPGYIAELDLVAVLGDGSFGSFCICWLDSTSKRGLFEPLGTRTSLQRRGLGRAVMLEGLRRLREHGAQSAAVGTSASHAAAIGLYQSVGMYELQRSNGYTKPILPPG